MTTTFIQTDPQRQELRRLLIEFAESRTTGPATARFTTKQELIDYGTIDLDYPEVLVQAIIKELELQDFFTSRRDASS